MKIAYSYIRWSTVAQSDGDSERRQLELARKYCAEKGYTLDESTAGADRGYSGFTGDNLFYGALGDFLKKVKAGAIPPGILIVENPDRLSRRRFSDVYRDVYLPICQAGIEIHFISESFRYVLPPVHDWQDTIPIGCQIDRSVGESIRKSEMLSKVWKHKKHNSKPGICITNKMPAWIEGKVGEEMQVNERKAKIVRRIFEMAANGFGKRLIARRLNQEKVPTFFEKPWNHSTIQKIWTNRAVLGEYQPHKGRTGRKGRGTNVNGESLKRVPDGEVRVDFFPAIVTADLWERAHAALTARRNSVCRGRTGKISNLFAGLVSDGNYGVPMQYEDKGKKSRPKLITQSKHLDGKAANTVDYENFEKAFLNWLDQLDWTSVIDAADSGELKSLEESIAFLALGINRNQKEIQNIIDLLIDTPSRELKKRLLLSETTLEHNQAEKVALEEQLAIAQVKHRDLLSEDVVYAKLSGAKDIETRARLRQEIKRKVSRIDIHFGEQSRSFMGAEALAKVRFTNGIERWVAFGAGLAVLVHLDGSVPPTFAI